MSADFRFKQFTVRQEGAAMKVSTDAVLLGAAASVAGNEANVLDIGTGTGVIALMIAQRLAAAGRSSAANAANRTFHILGIDIDEGAAGCASANFASSPWSGHLSARNISLADFAAECTLTRHFDLIVSNPPYFDSSLENPDPNLALARHTGEMSYRDILEFAAGGPDITGTGSPDRAAGALSGNGRLALILPADELARLLRHGRFCGLFPSRILSIRTTPRKKPSRIIVEFTRNRSAALQEDTLTLMDSNPASASGASRSEQYSSLTSDFYL